MKSQIFLPKAGKYAVLVIFLIIIQSCKNYYRVATAKEVPATPAGIIQANSSRYFILRTGSNAFYMNNVVLSDDKKIITCTLDTLPSFHKLHLHNGRGGHMRYKKNEEEAVVLNEIHVYEPTDTAAILNKNYSLGLNNVQKIEVLEKDKQRTTNSYLLGGVIITVGVAVVVVVVLAAVVASDFNNNGFVVPISFN